ncbi:MAG: methyltransferase domain-containing protein [Lactobacillales bacterium]|jgi:23S rRNA (cytidine2498-2'-O)-methyltransferase|nr:methyltransferase domain-containing protein [Lactobacillales bacterium]
MTYKNTFIVSISAIAQAAATEELKHHFQDIDVTRIDHELLLVKTSVDFKSFSQKIKNQPLFFIRHIFPVEYEIPLTGEKEDIQILANKGAEILETIPAKSNMLFQTKSDMLIHLDFVQFDPNYSKADFLKSFIKVLSKKVSINPKKATRAISMLVFKNMLYMGISDIEDNLNSWPLGKCRYQKFPYPICRAGFKIAEAVDTFGIDIKQYKTVLDLGAAPGGWTEQLLDMGLNVTAVDPAEMDSRVKRQKNFTHYAKLAQDFFKTNKTVFDMIVNDMRMDVAPSAELMLQAADFLRPDGVAVMTLKLRPKNSLAQVRAGIDILSQKYDLVAGRQLFYNRDEVTLVLKKHAA